MKNYDYWAKLPKSDGQYPIFEAHDVVLENVFAILNFLFLEAKRNDLPQETKNVFNQIKKHIVPFAFKKITEDEYPFVDFGGVRVFLSTPPENMFNDNYLKKLSDDERRLHHLLFETGVMIDSNYQTTTLLMETPYEGIELSVEGNYLENRSIPYLAMLEERSVYENAVMDIFKSMNLSERHYYHAEKMLHFLFISHDDDLVLKVYKEYHKEFVELIQGFDDEYAIIGLFEMMCDIFQQNNLWMMGIENIKHIIDYKDGDYEDRFYRIISIPEFAEKLAQYDEILNVLDGLWEFFSISEEMEFDEWCKQRGFDLDD